jgi:hypothetical protein
MIRRPGKPAFDCRQTLLLLISRAGSRPCDGKVSQIAASETKKFTASLSYQVGAANGDVAGRRLATGRAHMKTSVAALALATLIAVSAFAPAANAARRSDDDQSDGSWQCYPYCQGGTYEGRPVREWLKPDGW